MAQCRHPVAQPCSSLPLVANRRISDLAQSPQVKATRVLTTRICFRGSDLERRARTVHISHILTAAVQNLRCQTLPKHDSLVIQKGNTVRARPSKQLIKVRRLRILSVTTITPMLMPCAQVLKVIQNHESILPTETLIPGCVVRTRSIG